MVDHMSYIAQLQGCQNESDTALTGFRQLRAIFAALVNLSGDESVIADLAKVGVQIATEFEDGSRSASEEFQRVIEQQGKRGEA